MNIVYFVEQQEYQRKMSRVRFHSMEAIERVCMNFKWWGIDWPKYDRTLTVQENIDTLDFVPDLVIAYRPHVLNGFQDLKIPTLIRYNEMYNQRATINEIAEAKPNIVLCHHENDMQFYIDHFETTEYGHPAPRFIHVPHCADKSIYYPRDAMKIWDVMLVGAVDIINSLGNNHYPLRQTMKKVIDQMSNRYMCRTLAHPGYVHGDAYTNIYANHFAEEINSAKICLTCSGVPNSRFAKYIEIPMCGIAIAADIPGQDQNDFKRFVLEINQDMSEFDIITKLEHYLRYEDEREILVDEGLRWAAKYTQEDYANMFFHEIEGVL